MNQFELILASSSQTRKDLMNRLGLKYRCISPDIDESAMGELHADDLAKRLAYEKARVIAEQNPNVIIIGSDQVAWREHAPADFIGKPLSVENAIQQLQASSGKTVFFSTALYQFVCYISTLSLSQYCWYSAIISSPTSSRNMACFSKSAGGYTIGLLASSGGISFFAASLGEP